MSATNSCVRGSGAAGGPRFIDIPRLDVDPFSIEFFADPYPTHELLRDTGPVVYLDKWNVLGSPAMPKSMRC